MFSNIDVKAYYQNTATVRSLGPRMVNGPAKVVVTSAVETVTAVPKMLLGTAPTNLTKALHIRQFAGAHRPSLQSLGLLGTVNVASSLLLGATVGLVVFTAVTTASTLIGAVIRPRRSLNTSWKIGAVVGLYVGVALACMTHSGLESVRGPLVQAVSTLQRVATVLAFTLVDGVVNTVGEACLFAARLREDRKTLSSLIE